MDVDDKQVAGLNVYALTAFAAASHTALVGGATGRWHAGPACSRSGSA